MRRWLWVGVVVAVPLSVAVSQAIRPAGDNAVGFPKSALVGHAAPMVEGRDVMSAGSPLVRVVAGRWMVLTFFATWCVPCRKEQPELVRFVAAHAVLGDVGVVSVIYQDDPLAVRGFQVAHGGSWPVLQDRGGAVALSYAVLAVPESFVVNPAGVVVAGVLGGVKAARLDRIIATHPYHGPRVSVPGTVERT